MRLGALLGPITDAGTATTLADQSRMLETEGFQSLWSAQAIGRGFMLTDPLVALSVAAAVTQQVELGTAVLQVPLYHPADLAHRVMSLRQVCGDRLIFGVGAGSTEKDFAAFDRNYETRFADFTQSVNTLRRFFNEGQVENVDLNFWPVLQGGPPLFLGSWGNGVERAAQSFDGWIASAMYREPDVVGAALARYRQAGGQRAIVSTIVINHKTDLGELKDLLDQFDDAGFDDAVVMFQPGAPAATAVRKLVSR